MYNDFILIGHSKVHQQYQRNNTHADTNVCVHSCFQGNHRIDIKDNLNENLFHKKQKGSSYSITSLHLN